MNKFVLMLLPASLLAVSAFAQDVRYNFDRSADFSQYKTYKWVDIKDAAKPNDLVDQQIKNTFDAELASKGLAKTDAENADLYVGYQAAISQEKQFNSYTSGMGGWGYGAGWYGWGGPGMSTTTSGSTSTIHIGSLVFDMYDVSKKQIVWRGMASKTLDQKAKPEKQQKNLKKAVTKLLKNFPPPVKS